MLVESFARSQTTPAARARGPGASEGAAACRGRLVSHGGHPRRQQVAVHAQDSKVCTYTDALQCGEICVVQHSLSKQLCSPHSHASQEKIRTLFTTPHLSPLRIQQGTPHGAHVLRADERCFAPWGASCGSWLPPTPRPCSAAPVVRALRGCLSIAPSALRAAARARSAASLRLRPDSHPGAPHAATGPSQEYVSPQNLTPMTLRVIMAFAA